MPLSLIASRTTTLWPSKVLLENILKAVNNTLVSDNLFKKWYTTPPGTPGSGAGKGGGAGGSIKEAGGGLGRLQVANEEGYFYNKQKEQIEKLKKKLSENPDLSLKKKDK